MTDQELDNRLKVLVVFSLVNGGSVLLLAVASALIALLFQNWWLVLLCFLCLFSGGMELRGGKLLQQRKPRARLWLVASQLWLLGLILAYSLWRLTHSELDRLVPLLQVMIGDNLGLDQQTMTEIVHQANFAVYCSLIVITFLYQGGLALFYSWRCRSIFKLLPTGGNPVELPPR